MERFKKDLESLVERATALKLAMQYYVAKEDVERQVKEAFGEGADDFISKILNFKAEYQSWYSESLAVVKQVIPDREADFRLLYEKPRTNRKEILASNYTIADALHGLTVTRGLDTVVDPSAALPIFDQQTAILKSAERRFESSLFDVRQIAQADLFDDELDAAQELLKKKFARAAGAVAGVVLEGHLKAVCANRGVTIAKKAPGISTLNDALKDASVIDVPEWRRIQHLADIRNLCDHSKAVAPTETQVKDLIDGTDRVIKNVF